jgi:hypothetical protein
MQLNVPKYLLPEENIFNIRKNNWNKSVICENVLKMLAIGKKYVIEVDGINIKAKPATHSSELRKTISRTLEISVNMGIDKNLVFEYDLPWLIDNHFFIGGHKKVPIFQLYDRPVITRKEIIKVRTNIHTFTLYQKNSKRFKYNYFITCLGKEDIPFTYILCAFKDQATILSEFGVNEKGEIVNPRGKIVDPRDYLQPVVDAMPSLLRENYRDSSDRDFVEVMGQIKNRVANHVAMLARMFGSKGLASRVDRTATLEEIARMHSSQ